MRVIVITEPPVILPLADAKAHLAIDAADTHDDDKIKAYVAAATAHVDGPAGWLGRSLGEQTLEARRCGFPTWLRLPYGPVLSVLSVKYDDADGAEQTLDPSQYVVHGDVICQAANVSWPAVASGPESVRVQYEAGYADGKVPTPILQAIKLMVGDFYRFTESATMGSVNAVLMSATVERLLDPYRVWHV
jgi:uncharacterized phiE125 gp8 family phage protein